MIKIDILRAKYGISYNEISEMIGCSKTFAWQLINGKRTLSYKNAVLIAAVFDMKPDEIFYSEFTDNMLRKEIDKIKKINQVKINEKCENVYEKDDEKKYKNDLKKQEFIEKFIEEYNSVS